ncbi:hypothetical protein AB0N05_37245 [Nocardia sp. NPDC051030]|uniref:hypothetical protein n=1 Tax=Nocardia sp. NPDC051030 TaxID=3155162 RepID=UPI00342F9B99
MLMVLTLVTVIGVGAAGFYWKFLRAGDHRPRPTQASWGEHSAIAYSFLSLIPRDPAGTGYMGARCSAVGTIVVQAGDPVPVRQITCTDDHDVATWYTQYATPGDMQKYLDAHTVRVRDKEVGRKSVALYRPIDPAAPFTMATCKDVKSGDQTMLVEVSWPGRSFDYTYLNWWLWAPFEP